MISADLEEKYFVSPGKRRLAWMRRWQATIKRIGISGRAFWRIEVPERGNYGRLTALPFVVDKRSLAETYYYDGETYETPAEVIGHAIAVIGW